MMLFPKILTAILVLLSTSLFAQQDPVYASEGQRSFWFNPASIGTYNLYSINSVGRMNWIGVAAVQKGFQLNGSLKCLRIGSADNPFSTGAVGVNYNYETNGFLKSHQVTVPINMQFKLKKTYISVGLSPGVQNIDIEGSWFLTTNPSISSVSQAKFTTGAGVQWFGRNFSIGVASTHLFNERFERINYQVSRHYYLNGSYKQPLGDKFALGAVFVARTVESFSSAQAMVSGIFGSKNELTVGLGYRSRSVLLASVTKRFNKFYIGYFGEIYNSTLSNGGLFTHELRIAFELFDRGL